MAHAFTSYVCTIAQGASESAALDISKYGTFDIVQYVIRSEEWTACELVFQFMRIPESGGVDLWTTRCNREGPIRYYAAALASVVLDVPIRVTPIPTHLRVACRNLNNEQSVQQTGLRDILLIMEEEPHE